MRRSLPPIQRGPGPDFKSAGKNCRRLPPKRAPWRGEPRGGRESRHRIFRRMIKTYSIRTAA
eukprot:11552814-Alexandrium_andersonii.AAC.1